VGVKFTGTNTTIQKQYMNQQHLTSQSFAQLMVSFNKGLRTTILDGDAVSVAVISHLQLKDLLSEQLKSMAIAMTIQK